MGCASSKFVTRTNSFHEELRQNLQGKVNGLPVFEDLLLSKNGGEQFLSLVCAANTVTRKLHTVVPTLESDVGENPITEQEDLDTINTWELMAGLEERVEEERDEETNIDCFPVTLTPSRSFHAVEGEASKCYNPIDSGSTSLESSIPVQELPEDSGKSEPLVPSGSSCATGLLDTEMSMPPRSATTCEVIDNLSVEGVVSKGLPRKGDLTYEKGLRRRARAKELGKLNIPADAFKFPSIGSLRDWTNCGCTYATPKFGSASNSGELGTTGNVNDRSESMVFDPDIVAAFEEAMEKLTAEEELVLKQIIERWEAKGHVEILDNEEG